MYVQPSYKQNLHESTITESILYSGVHLRGLVGCESTSVACVRAGALSGVVDVIVL